MTRGTRNTETITTWNCWDCSTILLIEGSDMYGTYKEMIEDFVPGGISPQGNNQLYCLECADHNEIWETYYGLGTE